MELGVEGARHSGSLITAGLALEFGREVYGAPGNATQPSRHGPNQLIKPGAKLVTSGKDMIEGLPTPVRPELLPVEVANSEERAALVEQSLAPGERTLYDLLTEEQSRHIDDLVEVSRLTPWEVLAVLFDLELTGMVGQLPGKQFLKVQL
jgi:DNA processing protein